MLAKYKVSGVGTQCIVMSMCKNTNVNIKTFSDVRPQFSLQRLDAIFEFFSFSSFSTCYEFHRASVTYLTVALTRMLMVSVVLASWNVKQCGAATGVDRG